MNLGVAATGAGANPINPLTEFQRDAHGNVLVTTQFANGASVAADGQGYSKALSVNDRVTYAKFDVQGHTTQINDATGASRYYSYDAQGRLVKEWQTVTITEANGYSRWGTIWRAYEYDVLGRQIHAYAPSESVSLGTLTVSDTELSYNAFGEVTKKRVLDNGQALQGEETYDYDNAGRVWRTNAGDGVYKVLAYDMQGRQTAQLVSEGLDLKTAYQDTQSALNAQAANKAQFRRTDMRYDALGRLVQTLAPERATEQPMGITTRQNMLYGAITQSEVDIQNVPANYQRKPFNQVDLVWRSLEDLGSGDVRITLTYDTRPFTQTNPDGDSYNVTSLRNQTKTVIVPAEAAVEGYSLKWVNENQGAPGVGAVSRVKVEKLDVYGKWVSIYDVANTQASQTPPLNWTTAPSPGYLWNEAGDGRIPIYRYYNRYTATHFFSTSLTERERLLNAANGWLDEGITGYVSKDPKPGWVPLYRWTKVGAPEMSQYTNGATPTGGSWQYQGLEGYVASPSISDTEAANQGLTKLYRLQNNDSALGNGIYTTSESDRSALLGLQPAGDNQPNPRQVQMFGASTGLSIEVTYPQDLVSKTALEYRRYGSNDAWITAPTTIQNSFGSAHSFEVGALGLAPGGYEYRVRNTNAQMTRDVGSGTFSIYGAGYPDTDSLPAVAGVNQGNAIIDGSAYRVLQWPKPASGWTVEFRYRSQGSNGGWTSRTEGNGLFAYGDGRTRNMGIGMQGTPLNMGAGNFEYEVVMVNSATGERMRSTGTLNVPANPGMTNTSASPVSQNNNVKNLGVVGYVWSTPGPGRTPLYRFYFPYQGNDHHLTTADPSVIAAFQGMISSGAVTSDGILGYVETTATANNSRLYQYTYGGQSVYRLTARSQDIGSYVTLSTKPAAGFQWSPTTWYQNAYQFDGYISKVPLEGTTPLYAVYDGNSVGNQSQGDYLTSTQEHEITSYYLLDTRMAATANVAGVGNSQANIDGQTYNMLHWSTPEAGARVKISAIPAMPGSTPAIWSQGDGRAQFQGGAALQGIVLDALNPNTTYRITVEVQYPATAQRAAYIARSEVTITVPGSGGSLAVVQRDTTQAYTPQIRAKAGTPFNLSNRAVTNREYDRWGNLTLVDDPRVQAGQTLFKTSFTYNASNQITSQTQLASYEGPTEYTTTRIYYDALGRQVGVRDGMRNRDSLLIEKDGNLNAQVRDLAGNVVQERKADGGRIDLSYNAFGDKISAAERMTDTRTVVTNYRYDKLSRLTQTELGRAISRFEVQAMGSQITQAAGNGADHGANGVTLTGPITYTILETVQYDEAGRKVRVVNGNNEATRYRYDLAGNVTLSGQELVRTVHSLDKRDMTVPLSALGNTSHYRYDALGRKIGFTDGSFMSQDWRYDMFGRLTSRTDDQMRGGPRVQYQYTYNLAGQLTHESNTQGKSLDYRYDGAGQLIEIKDNHLGQLSSYTYDLAGNRLTEKLTQKTRLSSGVIENVVYQDNHLFYDAQNRLRASFDGRTDVRISYDLAGNRSQVKTSVINNLYTIKNEGKTYQSPGQYQQFVNESVTTYSYDAMNRQLASREYQGATPNGTLLKSHDYLYDQAGNRIQDTVFEKSTTAGVADTRGTYQYIYDDLHRLESYSGYGIAERTDTIRYDGAGRQVYAMSLARSNNLWNDEHRYNQYDILGRLQDTRVVMRRTDNQQKTQHTDIAYHGAAGDTSLGYDGAGYLRGTVQTTDGRTNDAVRTTYQYQFNGGYQQTSSTTTQRGRTATTNTWRDANGFISNIEQRGGVSDNRYNRAFVNDAQGNALYVNQGTGQFAAPTGEFGRIENTPGGYLGGYIGNVLNPGHIQRQLVANGEVLARYGDAPDSENPPQNGAVPKYVNTAEFHLDAAPLKLRDSNFSAMNYTVVGSETLKSIARNVLCDSSLWWRIAEANGLAVSGDGELTAGQTLSIPKLALNANNADTFQPYDPSRVTGSLDSVLPAPAGQGGGCGALGKIIMVAVAVVATIYTAGVLGTAAAGASTGFSATMSAGMSVLGGSAGLTGTTIAIGAASGAAGSIASQAAGNLLGVQDGFSWKGVALSAFSGGISSGLAGTPLFAGSNLDKLLLRSTVGNVLTQGVGVVTGLQSSFSWRGVAASAAGAVAGHVAGNLLGDAVGTASWDPWAKEMVTRTGAGLAAGTVASIAQGGRVSMQQVATDAFGSALGWSMAGAALPAQPNVFVSELQNSDRYAAQLRGIPGVQLTQNMAGAMITSSDDSASMLGINLPQTAPVLPEVVVRASDEDGWSNPFSNSTQSAAQWTVSNITGVARGATVEQLNSPNLYTNAQLIRATQGPSNGNIVQRSWNSPEVQGVAQRSGVGIVAAGIVQSLGDAWAGATGYNPVNNQYYSPLEQQQTMWGTVVGVAPLGPAFASIRNQRLILKSGEEFLSGTPVGLSVVTRSGSYSRDVSWFSESAVLSEMQKSSIGTQVLNAAKSDNFRLEFSKSYFQQGINGIIDPNLKGVAFETKAKIYVPAHQSNAEVARTAIHEGIHELGVVGSRRAEALARLAEIQHQGGIIDFSVIRETLRDIRLATDVNGNKVYMDMPWKLGEESDLLPGFKF
jgi:YD repeat-containing protein